MQEMRIRAVGVYHAELQRAGGGFKMSQLERFWHRLVAGVERDLLAVWGPAQLGGEDAGRQWQHEVIAGAIKVHHPDCDGHGPVLRESLEELDGVRRAQVGHALAVGRKGRGIVRLDRGWSGWQIGADGAVRGP